MNSYTINFHRRVRSTFILCLISLCLIAEHASAQIPAKQEPVKGFSKFKPPKVNAMLGSLSGSNAQCDVEQAKQLVRLPIRVEDEKKNSYAVTSYQFGYTRLGVVEDEETGKMMPQSDMVSQRFTATPLPELWVNTITESLRKGEQFYFFDIICADKQGRLFFAPELKITMK